jgi:hypothetical protein
MKEIKPEEAKPLRIVFARKPGKKYRAYRKPVPANQN